MLTMEEAKRREKSLEAFVKARKQTVKALKSHGVTVDKIAQRLGEALDAVFVHGDKEGEKEYVDHKIRLKAVEISAEFLDIKAPDRSEIDLKQPIQVIVQKFTDSEEAGE